MFLGGSCALAGIILFCSFFTIGTTVSYDGQVPVSYTHLMCRKS